ncbi:MAG: FRG domain-containing protein [Deltaproteobacteria bacterium]|nr:FRG domain-containing protein [Deltaproteobacteria bacterium]
MTLREIPTITITRFSEIHNHQKPGWIFRGVSDPGLPLASKLERACKSMGIPLSKAAHFEAGLMREFRRRYHLYSSHVPNVTDDVQWLAVMQHYGSPTRLLDWTYSVYVAAYFGLERAQKNAVVWKINLRWCVDECAKSLERAGKGSCDIEYIVSEHTEKHEGGISPFVHGEASGGCYCSD